MANLPLQQTLPQMQSKWKSLLDPVLQNLLVNGRLVENQQLTSGNNTINHGLGRAPIGWFLVSPKSAATVYEAAYQPNPTLTLTLTASGSITCSIWVF